MPTDRQLLDNIIKATKPLFVQKKEVLKIREAIRLQENKEAALSRSTLNGTTEPSS